MTLWWRRSGPGRAKLAGPGPFVTSRVTNDAEVQRARSDGGAHPQAAQRTQCAAAQAHGLALQALAEPDAGAVQERAGAAARTRRQAI